MWDQAKTNYSQLEVWIASQSLGWVGIELHQHYIVIKWAHHSIKLRDLGKINQSRSLVLIGSIAAISYKLGYGNIGIKGVRVSAIESSAHRLKSGLRSFWC